MGASAGEGEPARYRAFLSYSHQDAAFGRRLHRRLEGYGLPRRLAGRTTARGEVPRRVAPIFRDRDELSAAGDLTAEVKAALAASDALIVVCSPAAAASPWVSREIELFRALHPDRPILAALAALAAGEPRDAFPPALAADGLPEPLAADFRPGGDGGRVALLKLVAGVVGLGLDELIQRDAQRRLAGVMAVTAVSVAAMLAMGALTIFALASRAEAQAQRVQAEAMVEFMLTDLRDRLKGVGRLDVMDAVNRRALAYYGGQALDRLPPESLERRARLFHAMGEDDLKRADLDAAHGKFAEADRTTTALLAAAPDDPDRIWAQAQSDYWLGYVDFQRGHRAQAEQAWTGYLRLARNLVALQPDNPKYLREAGYAEGDVCTLGLQEPRNLAVALPACRAGLDFMQRAARKLARDSSVMTDVAHRHAWLGDACQAVHDRPCARTQRLAEEAILAPLMASDPKNMALRQDWVAHQRAMAGIDYQAGEFGSAKDRLAQALQTVDQMIAFDPANEEWAAQRSRLQGDLAFFATKH